MNSEKLPQKIIEKNGIKITKITSTNFNLSFDIKNNNIILPSIINFDLIQLIVKLNPNIFEKIEVESVSETETESESDTETNKKINVLFKDIFSDIGLPQYYISLNVNKSVLDTNKIVFNSLLYDNKLICYPDDVEFLSAHDIIITFEIMNNHFIKINGEVTLLENHRVHPFCEKLIGNIIYNIFIRLKQFIENIVF
jgi:hypothetical protein